MLGAIAGGGSGQQVVLEQVLEHGGKGVAVELLLGGDVDAGGIEELLVETVLLQRQQAAGDREGPHQALHRARVGEQAPGTAETGVAQDGQRVCQAHRTHRRRVGGPLSSSP